MELFGLKQGGAQDPALLPPGSSASRVAPEGHRGGTLECCSSMFENQGSGSTSHFLEEETGSEKLPDGP